MSRIVIINDILKNIILELVDYFFMPKNKLISVVGRKPKCSNEQYLENIFFVLKEGIGWNYLKGLPVKGDTVRKKHKQWCDKHIFKLAWIIMVNIYAEFKLDFNDLFIDCSHIKNYYGKDIIGKNIYDRFRNSTKLSIITDDFGIPIGICIGAGNAHDITLTEDTINSINFELDHYFTEYLIA
jgi:hypothetical protein